MAVAGVPRRLFRAGIEGPQLWVLGGGSNGCAEGVVADPIGLRVELVVARERRITLRRDFAMEVDLTLVRCAAVGEELDETCLEVIGASVEARSGRDRRSVGDLLRGSIGDEP